MTNLPTIHWLFPMPTPYGKDFFRALHEAGFVRLIVSYSKEQVLSHPWKVDLRIGHVGRIQRCILGIDWFLIKEALFNRRAVFVGGWRRLTNIIIIIICIALNRNYIFQTDTPNLHKKRNRVFAAVRSIFLKTGLQHAGSAILFAGDRHIAVERFQSMGAPHQKLIHFPFWIDVNVFTPHDTSDKQSHSDIDFLRFISIGRVLNKRKGHDLAIRSLAAVNNRNREFNFEYLIAGTGPDVEALNKLAQDLGISKQIKVLGWLDPDQVRATLACSDVLIHPSPVDEPYGVAVIEAMASGLTVVASDVTFAALDRIEDGVNGLIYKAGDVEALAQKIAWCFEHHDRLHEIGEAARNNALEWPVNRGVAIFKDILTRAGVVA